MTETLVGVRPAKKDSLLRPSFPTRWFPRQAAQAAFLLGGIGTGNVSIGSRGELRDWEIFNWPGKGSFLPFSLFALRAHGASGTFVRVLEAQHNPPHAKSHGYFNGELAGLPRFADSAISATYPFVRVTMSEAGSPVEVEMEAFTPFVPGDADASGFPAAVIRYHVTNTTAEPLGSLSRRLDGQRHRVPGIRRLRQPQAGR
jgi:uncharacterized protein (DUF608 family)